MKKTFAVALLLGSLAAAAQKGKSKKAAPPATRMTDTVRVGVRVLAQAYRDSVVVRWTPVDAHAWAYARAGYRVHRRTYRREGKSFRFVDSASFSVRPWTLDQWGAYYKSTHDSSGAFAAQMLYGKPPAEKPEDDHNVLARIKRQYDEQQNRFGLAMVVAEFDPAVATGEGLRLSDKKLAPDQIAVYSVTVVPSQGNVRSDTAETLVRGSEVYARKAFPAISAAGFDRVVRLRWDNALREPHYSGFNIERSSDGQNFVRVNRKPFVSLAGAAKLRKPVEFADSLPQNYRTYYYRVTGLTAFGDESLPSPVLAVSGADLTPPPAPVITTIATVKGVPGISLTWNKPAAQSDIRGYVVGRGSSMKGPFSPISGDLLPFGTSRFVDPHPSQSGANFYVVSVIDTAGNAARSKPAYVSVEDHQPPARPEGFAGSIDSGGIVSLHWNWGREDDLAGYRLFFANAPDHVFTPVGGDLVSDSLYFDSTSLNTLSRRIYYKLIAYDRKMNPSVATPILTLVRPDRIAPATASIRGFRVTDSSIRLSWNRSASADLAQQLLYRQTDSANWVLLATLGRADTSFADTHIAARHYYSYSIESVDSSGLHSPRSFPLRAYANAGTGGPVIRDFHANAGGGRTVRLTWTAPANVDFYILYADEGGSGLRMTGNIPGAASSWQGKAGAGAHRYALKAVFRSGGESPLTSAQSVQIE